MCKELTYGEKQLVEEKALFGENEWIYCGQHLRPHLTGWCTVSTMDKLGLGIPNEVGGEAKAYEKCRRLKLPLFEDMNKS